MLAAVLLLTLAVQQPAQQPASTAKPKAHAAQVADTSKTKSKSHSHHSSSTKQKSKSATSSSTPRDTTKN
jgi:cytoskeletal protein RodZ